MATLGPVYANFFMESRKRQLPCHGVPLPYMIRPRRIFPPIDTFDYYNDESDGEDSSMEAEGTSCLNKVNCFGLGNESNASLSELACLVNDEEEDEGYVFLKHVEALPNIKTERAGAIQMMELSKDMVDDDESKSEDAGSDSDDWVVV